MIETYDKREIRIRVVGRHKRDLLTIISHELNKIHQGFKNLKFQKLIPCNCITCKESQNPHFYSFDVLREFISDNQTEIQCQKKPFQMVSVLQLIDSIGARASLSEEYPDKDAGLTIGTVQGDVFILSKGDGNVTKRPKSQEIRRNNPLVGVAVYGGLAVIILAVLLAITAVVSNLGLPFTQTFMALVGGAIAIIVIIIASQLMNDDRIGEEAYLKILKSQLVNFPSRVLDFIESRRK